MVLALLVLALPTAALANSFTFTTGDFQSGFFGFGGKIAFLYVSGTQGSMTFDTETLSLDSTCFLPGTTCRSFGISQIFFAGPPFYANFDLHSGIMAPKGLNQNGLCSSPECTVVIFGVLRAIREVQGTVSIDATMGTTPPPNHLTSGTGVLSFRVVPEPS